MRKTIIPTDQASSPPMPPRQEGPATNGEDTASAPAPIPAPTLPSSSPPSAKPPTAAQLSPQEQAALDQEEADYRAVSLDEDDPGAVASIAAINTVKTPDKELFWRTKRELIIRLYLATSQQGLNATFLGVTKGMVEAMRAIGIKCYPHRLYLTITKLGGLQLVPVRIDSDNTWTTSKEQALVRGMSLWTRIASDEEAGMYQDFQLPPGTYPEPIWPALTEPKIIQLAFRIKGRLVDSIEHPYYVRLLTGKEPTKALIDTSL